MPRRKGSGAPATAPGEASARLGGGDVLAVGEGEADWPVLGASAASASGDGAARAVPKDEQKVTSKKGIPSKRIGGLSHALAQGRACFSHARLRLWGGNHAPLNHFGNLAGRWASLGCGGGPSGS